MKQPAAPPSSVALDGVQVDRISTQLRPAGADAYDPRRLVENRDRAFAGVVPQAKGFVVSSQEAEHLLKGDDADYAQVVRRFLTGEDLASSPTQAPNRWIIDFGSMALEDASRYPKALALVRSRVKPEREASTNRGVEKRWWLFGRRVEGMRFATSQLPRFAAAAATSKWFPVAWSPSAVCPNNAVCVFAFSDDFSIGMLLARPHVAWAWARSSTLKGDLRYTSAAVFDTFPWPDEGSDVQRETVADVCRRLLARRSELCLEHNVGLTKLYNAMDEGAYTDLKALHRELDEAVTDCYGWPKAIAQDDKELVVRLTEVNRQIVEGEREYHPFEYLK